MLEYQNVIRASVLMDRGIVSTEQLDSPSELDKEIIKIASKWLSPAPRMVFYFAFGCAGSWERIQEIYKSRLGKDLDEDTIRRYGTDAKKTIIMKAKKS